MGRVEIRMSDVFVTLAAGGATDKGFATRVGGIEEGRGIDATGQKADKHNKKEDDQGKAFV